MKLIDGLKLEGTPAYIPDCSRDDLPEFFVEMGYKTGVEVGTYRGEFTELFCKAGLVMFTVDPWIVFAGGTPRYQNQHDDNYEITKDRLSKYSNCTIIRKTSMEAVEDFKDGSLDFVYLDGNHSFRYVADDLWEWSKKVRKGGIVSGHDLHNSIPSAQNILIHVKAVVECYTKLFKMERWYCLGQRFPGSNERRDANLSWMWIK